MTRDELLKELKSMLSAALPPDVSLTGANERQIASLLLSVVENEFTLIDTTPESVERMALEFCRKYGLDPVWEEFLEMFREVLEAGKVK